MAKVSLRNYNREIEAMTDRGQLDEAIAHCQHILKTFPKHLETYRLLGKAFLEYKRYKDAVDIFSRVLVVEPNDFVANVGMSIIRDEEDKLDDAIWHMERAFEVQSANPAIQGELQRLYGRREGVQPPRIRMTRGALAHMYMQGELYPQAISEVKSVLNEDAGRTDMQVLMARAYFKSGQKNDAADTASAVLRRYPYCLDANRILVEILGADRPENSQLYRQRVIELDPYAAQVSGSIFESNEVGDAAVTLEHFEWSGQPVAERSDWRSAQAISLDDGRNQGTQGAQAQPDWLKSGDSADSTPTQPPSTPKIVTPLSASTPTFAMPASTPSFESQPAAAPTPEADIPDFLRAAGWGESTGTFDESKPIFADQPAATPVAASDALPIAQGDMPDWLKAMAPPQATQQPAAQPAEEEEVLPDWINKIGTSALPVTGAVAASDEFDWLNPTDQTSEASVPTSDDQPDWMKQLDQPTSTPATDQPDWMKGLGEEPVSAPTLPADDQFDWMKQLDQPASAPGTDQPDWMKGFGEEPASAPALPADDQPDWMKQLSGQSAEPALASSMPAEFDFLNELTAPSQPAVEPTPAPSFTEAQNKPAANVEELGKSQSDIDDSLAWFESLAAKQGATEGLLIKPEDRMDKEPDWVKQVKSVPDAEPAPVLVPTANVEELGKSQSDIDDSLAWFESLAAKQGATEGLLIKPEDRKDVEPDWVKQVKSAPAESTPASVPIANVEELGKSQSDIDDSLAWFEGLAAKQGATEGLLIKPEDRMDKEPDWVKQVKSVPAESTPASVPIANVEELGKSQSDIDDSLAWFEGLAAKQGATEGLLIKPEDRKDVEPDWVKQAKSAPQPFDKAQGESPVEPVHEEHEAMAVDDTTAWLRSLDAEDEKPQPVTTNDDTAMWLQSLDEPEPVTQAAPADDMPAWLQGLDEEKAPVAESAIPANEPAAESDWMDAIEEHVAVPTPVAEDESAPSWLKGIDEESSVVSASLPQDDLPAWMRDETGEVMAEPTRIQPTRPTDWHPVEEKQPEAPAPQPVVSEQPKPEPVAPVQEKPKPVPVKKAPPKPTEVKPATPPAPYREPVTIRGTGMLTMPPVDPILGSARAELTRSNIPGALETYGKLIKKGRFLDEVIFDLRDSLYRYPVEVSIWQSLGDAYMRANRLQDALDAYTKAEELLR